MLSLITRVGWGMDPELSALAATAAATLVGLLTTDAWERVKGGLGALWRRAHPERAGTIEAEIAESRDELLPLVLLKRSSFHAG